ncbi:hypothetical protein F2Q70_00041424 [Brassica cretica]|uniref:Uncharacterized protein n=1 Tax=Brassica cretica TaxID=69181 RepID=A0A8S9K0T8_BRACR|nr:hypothetical protein F2Q70_00041424 [Brassica cretica]
MDRSKPARASMLIGPRPAAFTITILLSSMMMTLSRSLKPILIYSTGSVRNQLVTTIRKTRQHMNLSSLFMPIFTGLLGSCFS